MADIIQRFKKTLDKSVATVSVKSNALIEINKIKVHMNSLMDRIKEKKLELGEVVYSMYAKDDPDQEVIASLCEEIAQLYEQYNEKEEEIEKIKQEEVEILGGSKKEKRCDCGNVVPEGYKFCTSCGNKIG